MSHEQSETNFSHMLDILTEEQLKDILRVELASVDIDVELIKQVNMRLKSKSHQRDEPDADLAWKEFTAEHSISGALYAVEEESSDVQASQGTVSRRWRKPLLRIALVAALMAALMLAGTVTAYAFGYDLWGAVARWTAETFGFSSEVAPEKQHQQHHEIDSELRYNDLQSAIDALGIAAKVVPTWLPDGFALDECRIDVMEHAAEVRAWYAFDNKSILVLIKERYVESSTTYEKDDRSVTEYLAGGTYHYLMTNLEEELAVWAAGNLECSISGDVSREELISMIDSIYER